MEKISSKQKKRNSVTNDASVKESIFDICHSLYTEGDISLKKCGRLVGLNITAPRKKIIIMIMGNHSSGKSSFINWYIGDKVQSTGVAIETQGFTFVTHGKKRESLTGRATLHLHQNLRALESFPSLVDYLSTEITPAVQNKFAHITFIDTPGLVDGNMYYPYDVEKSIMWFGNMADLILVFFDPIGQALCRRALDLVQSLNKQNSEKLRFYLSKADEAGEESDRQKVMMQIVQEICKRPGLNRAGFKMPTIYLPDPNLIRPTKCINQIDDIHDQIERTINFTVQNNLNNLDKDCERVVNAIEAKLKEDSESINKNFISTIRITFYAVIILLFSFLISFQNFSNSFLKSIRYHFEDWNFILDWVHHFWMMIPSNYVIYIQITFIVIIILFSLLLIRTKFVSTISRSERKKLITCKSHIELNIKGTKHSLYLKYLSQFLHKGELNI